MATLSVSNTFVAGTIITAAAHNTNFSDVVSWANGNIGHTNLSTLTGTVTFSVSTNTKALDITGTGTEGSVSIAHNGILASGKSGLSITSNAASLVGTALVNIAASSGSNTVPSLLITDAGVGSPALKVVSTTKPSHPRPSMTSTQRNALTSMAAGDEIFNTTLARPEYYDGASWVDGAGRTGEIVDFAGATLPAYLLRCEGQSLLRTDYPGLFAKLSTTWGAVDGTHFTLPDLRGRTTIGDGTGSGLTARTLAGTVGVETHTLSGAETGTNTHTHGIANTAHTHGGGGLYYLLSDGTTGTGQGGATFTTPLNISFQGNTGAEVYSVAPSAAANSNTNASSAHQNMQPSAVVKKCVVI